MSQRQTRHGVSVVELAIVLPILVTLALGCVDFGRFAYYHIAVTNAARAGAGFGAMHPYTTTTQANWEAAIATRATNEMAGVQGYDSSKLTIVTTPTIEGSNLRRVRVHVTYTFDTYITWPFLPNSSDLTTAAEMRIVR